MRCEMAETGPEVIIGGKAVAKLDALVTDWHLYMLRNSCYVSSILYKTTGI